MSLLLISHSFPGLLSYSELHSLLPATPISLSMTSETIAMLTSLAHNVIAICTSPAVFSLIITWAIWRLWTFSLRPMFKHRQPMEVPYSVPFLGHALSFFGNTDKTLTRCREYFGKSRKMFSIIVGGQRIYIVTDPHDANLLYRRTTTLTFDGFIIDMMSSLGFSGEGLNRAWGRQNSATPPDKSFEAFPHAAQSIYRASFVPPGEGFDQLWGSIQSNIDKNFAWGQILEKSIVSRTDSGNTLRLNLWSWCRQGLLQAVITATFGDKFLNMDPELINKFVAYDDESWKITYRMPNFAKRNIHKNLDMLKAAVAKYIDLPREFRTGASSIIDGLEDLMQQYQLPRTDMATSYIMLLWLMNSNAYKLAYWVLAFILCEPGLLELIREETKEAMNAPYEEIGTQLVQCRRLVSVYYEVLRLTVGSATVRDVSSDTVIGGMVLKAGNKVMVPYRQLHFDDASWGPDAHRFDPERFLRKGGKLEKSPSFRPFGGGITYCPGRILAMREIFWFVALAIHRFDVRWPSASTSDARGVKNGQCWSTDDLLASIDSAMPTLGVLPVVPGKLIDIEVSMR